MQRLRACSVLFLVVSALYGCSIALEQPSIPTPSLEPTSSSPVAIPEHTGVPLMDETKVPVTWGDLNLTGKLVYLNSTTGNEDPSPGIQILDLKTGDAGTLFRAPKGAWIFYLDISPDGKQVVLSYIDPAQPEAASNRALYRMPLDASTPPQLVFQPPSPDDHYTQVEWSPDGKHIYYTHYNNRQKELIAPLTPDYDIVRLAYPEGDAEHIADHAFWPRLSADGSKLTYVTIEAGTGKNALFVANADGSDPKQVVFSAPWDADIIDAPVFTPDGDAILFSVPSPTEAYKPNLFDILTGVQVVKAHDVPSDWWSVPVAGGKPTRLTHLQTANLFASLLPDRAHLASISGAGLFVMGLDGSSLMRLLPDASFYGTVRWVP